MNKDHFTISIVTPSFNQGNYLEQTIQSVINQKGDFKIDYIIVDGGSTDNSLAIIRHYENLLHSGQWPLQCKAIEYRWISEKDSGQAEAVNKGLRLARGEIIGWLNSDDTFFPDALAAVEKAIDPDAGKYVVMGRCLYIDEDGNSLKREHPSDFSSHARVVKIWKGYTIPQPAVFFHRKVYETCGGLDENLYFALDYDLFLRFSKLFGFVTIDRIFATYRLHLSSKTTEISSGVLLEKSLAVSRRYWGEPNSPSYWNYFLSYCLYGGRLGVLSLKKLNLAEAAWQQNRPGAFLGQMLLSAILFPPTIFRFLVMPRLKRLFSRSPE